MCLVSGRADSRSTYGVFKVTGLARICLRSMLGSGHVLGGIYSSSESDMSSSDPELKSSRMDRIPAGESPPRKTPFIKVRK